MPGAFPNVPPPNPGDENPDQAAFAEGNTADPFIDEAFESEPSERLEAAPTSEAELPPEAQGEANGGPLGCCLGISVGIMLCLFLGLIGFGQLLASGIVLLVHADAITNIRIATGLLAVIGALLGGISGWKIGKRVYREYELSPRQKKRLEQLEQKYRGRTRQARP
jgi:hypothetical protein